MGQVLPDGSELCAFGKPLPHDHEGPDDHCVWVPDDVAWARSQEAEWADAARRAAYGPPRRQETILAVTIRPQWKGTVLCADWTCTCGTFNHVDDITFGVVTCGLCGSQFRMETDVLASPVASPE